MEQRHAEALFERRNGLADRGLPLAGTASRGREAAGLRYGNEGAQFVEAVQTYSSLE
jgi:hypothetical protein